MKVLLVAVLAFGTLAQGASRDVGNIALIEDPTGSINGATPKQSEFCKAAAKAFFLSHGDEYDGLVTFSAANFTALENTQQGSMVRTTASGLGGTAFNLSSLYRSGGTAKLGQCVFMGSLDYLPDNPNAQANTAPFVPGLPGLPYNITGVELVGHEYGHHWLVRVDFDKADGQGPRKLLRGWEEAEYPEEGHATNHYAHLANTNSVMYGNFITDNGGGNFSVAGGDRKFSELDQYLMGLRFSNEVSPMFVVDKGDGKGQEVMPTKKGSTSSATGTRVDFTMEDVLRVMGPRTPAADVAPRCWKVAFVLVANGTNVTQKQLDTMEAYRARFSEWFGWATDGRGTMETRLNYLCPVPGTDGGVVIPEPPVDAGSPEVPVEDAGTLEPLPEEDAGTVPQCDPPSCPSLPTESEDAGVRPVKYDTVDGQTGKLKPGCDCSGVSGEALFGVSLLAGLWGRRSKRRGTSVTG